MSCTVHEGICQSCAMPVHKEDLLGTDSHGRKVDGYCKYCFQYGKFTEPEIGVKEMVDKCVGFITNAGVMPEAHVREMLSVVIPRLKRWSNEQYEKTTQ